MGNFTGSNDRTDDFLSVSRQLHDVTYCTYYVSILRTPAHKRDNSTLQIMTTVIDTALMKEVTESRIAITTLSHSAECVLK